MNRLFIMMLSLLLCHHSRAQFSFDGVVAHRAGIYNDPQFPENSLAALGKAAAMGIYAAEIDVHLTKDHIPVVFHDHEHNGMHVEKSTYQELLSIKLSNGEQIPTLEQYIHAVLDDPKLKLWIDMKRSQVSKARDVLLARYTADIINRLHAQRRIEIISPSFDALVMIRQLSPVIRLYYIGTDKTPETLKLLGFDGVNLQYKRYDRNEYSSKDAQHHGLIAASYVVDDPAEMRRQLELGINFITTNKPQLLIDVLKQFKKDQTIK